MRTASCRIVLGAFLVGILSTCPSLALSADASRTEDDRSQVERWCKDLSQELKSVNFEHCIARPWKVESTTQKGHIVPSVQWGSESGDAQKSDGHRVLVLAAIHGDEISAVSMAFRWLDFLDRTKPDSFLRKKRFLFFPLVNPDGFHAKPRTRTNASGVDLNRNFETKEWGSHAKEYWKKRAGGERRRFPGDRPASELETQVIQKAIAEFKPDLIISIHAPYRLVDHDGPIQFPNIPSPLPIRTLGSYPGSLGTYAGIERNIPVVTPELRSATTLPDLKSVEQLFLFIMKSEY